MPVYIEKPPYVLIFWLYLILALLPISSILSGVRSGNLTAAKAVVIAYFIERQSTD